MTNAVLTETVDLDISFDDFSEENQDIVRIIGSDESSKNMMLSYYYVDASTIFIDTDIIFTEKVTKRMIFKFIRFLLLDTKMWFIENIRYLYDFLSNRAANFPYLL